MATLWDFWQKDFYVCMYPKDLIEYFLLSIEKLFCLLLLYVCKFLSSVHDNDFDLKNWFVHAYLLVLPFMEKDTGNQLKYLFLPGKKNTSIKSSKYLFACILHILKSTWPLSQLDNAKKRRNSATLTIPTNTTNIEMHFIVVFQTARLQFHRSIDSIGLFLLHIQRYSIRVLQFSSSSK